MSAYIAGGSGSGDTHLPRSISGKKAATKKVVPAKIVKKAGKRGRLEQRKG